MNESFHFSDGFTLPKGTVFAFPAYSCALDSDNLDNAGDFDPFRYAAMAKHDRDQSDNRWSASQAGVTNMAYVWCSLDVISRLADICITQFRLRESCLPRTIPGGARPKDYFREDTARL
jgi:hypothetical protein